jgi:hypothetical protein
MLLKVIVADKNVVLTGKHPRGLPHAFMMSALEAEGAIVQKAISSKTNLILCAPGTDTKALSKARAAGIQVLAFDDVFDVNDRAAQDALYDVEWRRRTSSLRPASLRKSGRRIPGRHRRASAGSPLKDFFVTKNTRAGPRAKLSADEGPRFLFTTANVR